MRCYISTAIAAEEKYHIINCLDYMMAIKVLKESGCDISKMACIDFYQDETDLISSILECIKNIDFIEDNEEYDLYMKIKVNKNTSNKITAYISTHISTQENVIEDSIEVQGYQKGCLYIRLILDNFFMWGSALYELANFTVKINEIIKEEESENTSCDK